MYRLILDSLLGLRREPGKLHFEPCLPDDWESFKVHYRYRETLYHISVRHITALHPGNGSEASVTAMVSSSLMEQFHSLMTILNIRSK